MFSFTILTIWALFALLKVKAKGFMWFLWIFRAIEGVFIVLPIITILLVALSIIPRIIPWVSTICSILRLLPHEGIPPIHIPSTILTLIAPLIPLLLIMRVIACPSRKILAGHTKLTGPIRSKFPLHHLIISLIFHSPLQSTNKRPYAYKTVEHKYNRIRFESLDKKR